jgi:Galactose oxidase, central domain/Kelch motif
MNATTLTMSISAVAATFWAVLNPVAATTTATAAFSAGQWTEWGQLNEGRLFHATVELIDGRLLTIAGNYGPQSSTELFDPLTRTWTWAASLPRATFDPAAVRLSDGRVLVAGGTDATGGAVASTSLYDAVSNSWQLGPPMLEPRAQGQVVTLDDGRVLAVGGEARGLLDSVEIYDGVWHRAASVPYAPGLKFSLERLNDGRVLLAGGLATASSYLASAALYDPPTDTWERLPDMSVPRLGHSATLLLDGRVLIAGGTTSSGTPDSIHRTTEIFNPATKTWTASGPMAAQRNYHRAVRLPDGRVLVAGGAQFGGITLREAELFYPAIGRWEQIAPMQHRRYAHTLTLLRDGSVLAVGGHDGTTGMAVRETELFTADETDTTPPYVACSAEPAVLWPPDDKLVPVNVKVEVTDDLSGAAGFNLVAAIANEGDATLDIVGFAVGTADTAGQLRASRNGGGNGRIYELIYEGRDVAGNTATCTTTVTVPHDRRR